jgi:predicted polyphosphate/ATP-dependent NAD kinase
MDNFAARLQTELVDAGIPVVGVSIGENMNTSTWTVQPAAAQPAAQPVIDAVNTSQWTLDAHYDALRTERNVRLFACDWTQLQDTQLAASKVVSWATHRQQLRDLPATTTDPTNPPWPIDP